MREQPYDEPEAETRLCNFYLGSIEIGPHTRKND